VSKNILQTRCTHTWMHIGPLKNIYNFDKWKHIFYKNDFYSSIQNLKTVAAKINPQTLFCWEVAKVAIVDLRTLLRNLPIQINFISPEPSLAMMGLLSVAFNLMPNELWDETKQFLLSHLWKRLWFLRRCCKIKMFHPIRKTTLCGRWPRLLLLLYLQLRLSLLRFNHSDIRFLVHHYF